MQIISRKAAKVAGLRHYFTGKPCKRGHLDKRFVSSFLCMECAREKQRDIYRQLDDESRRGIGSRRRDYFKQWYQEHREEQKPKYAAHRLKAKEQDPDYFKRYYATNKERRKQESQGWYRDNSDRAAVARKSYVAANPDKVRAWGRKSANTRRAITKHVFVEVVDPRVVFERDKGICGICLKSVDPASHWEVDHVTPISKGGPHSYANTQLSHRKCNRAKSNRLLSAS